MSRTDAELFTEVYARTYRSAVLLAYATTGSLAEAEDIAQDAYAQLYRSWGGISAPESWLRRAVVSLCTSWVRRQVRARRACDTLPAIEHAPALEDAIVTWQALSGLSERQRAAVALRFVEDLSEQDIAAALGCRPGTVKSLLSRALRSLEQEFRDAGR